MEETSFHERNIVANAGSWSYWSDSTSNTPYYTPMENEVAENTLKMLEEYAKYLEKKFPNRKEGKKNMWYLWRITFLHPRTGTFETAMVTAKSREIAVHKALERCPKCAVHANSLEMSVEQLIEYKKPSKKK